MLRLMLLTLLGGCALACLGAAAPAPAPATPVLRATLDNGLRVIIARDALAPVVATAVNYLVGSDEAPPGFPGTAHAQEHMMFRGSPGLSGDQLADLGSIMGGNFNANTRESVTQYLYTVPADDLGVALRIEALRMRGVLDSEAGWNEERGAIEQEVAQDLSDPGYVLYSKLRALAFAGTPYAHDALGTRPSFERTTAQMLKQFHDHWYAPNNAILVIVGDVDPQATLAKVRELFGPIPRKPLPTRPVVSLPTPLAPASFSVDTDQPNGTLMIAFRTPGLDSADFPALEVLADVLNNRRFDLYGLVPRGKALEAGFALDPLPQAGLAYASASFPAGADVKALEHEVRSILERVVRDGVPADLVAAAKLQERRESEFERNSIAGFASVWSDAVAVYGLSSPEEDLERIEKVTVEDVNRVARKYLTLDHAITALMRPQGAGRPVVATHGFGGQENISLGEAHATELPQWAEAAVRRLSVPAATTHPIVTQLPNGLTLIVQPEDVSDTVSVFGHIRNRPEMQTPRGQEGVSQILEQLLTYGTERLDRVAFQRALDAIGAQERAGTDFAVETLAENFERAVQLLADNQLHPALPEAAMQVTQQELAEVVEARNRSPSYLAQRSLRGALFPANDPSLRQSTAQSVRSVTLADVRAYHRQVFRPDLTSIVVIGRVTAEQAQSVIGKYFGGWSASGPRPQIDLPPAPANRASVIAVPDATRVQDRVVLAQNLTLTRANPAYYALQLGSAVLGGGFYSTRLSIELRKNTGLVYSVGSALEAGRTRSVYLIQYACDPQNVTRAAGIALQEIRSLQSAPPSTEELTRVKALLLHEIPLHESSQSEIAAGFLERRDLDLPLDEPMIAARRFVELSAADVQSAFAEWMRPADMVRVSQGPARR